MDVSEVKKVEQDTEIENVVEEVELSEKQVELIEQMPEVSTESALENISKMYSYRNLAEKELKTKPLVPLATDKEGVATYLAYGLAQFMKGEMDAAEFMSTYQAYLDESYLALYGESEEMRIQTMQTVYDSSFKGIPETKITNVFISNTIVSKTAGDVIVAYRRHVLENGEEQFYEMGFAKDTNNKWLLLDNRLTVNPYAEDKENDSNLEDTKIEGDTKGE